MKVLIVGGAGYIGSHVSRILSQHGHELVILDNLSVGFAMAVKGQTLIEGDIQDQQLVEKTLRDHKIEAVMHFAAYALVGESVLEPAKYFDNNVVATFRLLEAMRECDVKKFVFSSTCATYGIPKQLPITESTPQLPVNPYGHSKLFVERMLDAYREAYGFEFACLRYFNAAGASPLGDIGEDHDPESHLIPIVLQVALGKRDQVTIFGDDWPTPDGTCVRDYVHVDDLGTAHEAALRRLSQAKPLKLNIGTGKGFSVRQVIDVCRKVTGHEIPAVLGPRRPGDPPELVADTSLAKQVLDWQPKYQELLPIVETAWNWHQNHPDGYRSS